MYKSISLSLLSIGILACGQALTAVESTALFTEESIDLKLPDPPTINAVCDYLFQTGDFDCDFNPLALQQQCQNDYLSCPLYLTDREFPEGLGFIENLPTLEGDIFTYGLPEAALRIAIQSQIRRGKPRFTSQLAVATSPLATVEIQEFRVGPRQGEITTINPNQSIILQGPILRNQRCYEIRFIYTDPLGSQQYRISTCNQLT